jgi:16S rRNA (cytidine1402-2'-O)-methyltransferase
MVATPIGNLADISLRALHVLQLVDAIACEDTRHSGQLLRAYGISKPLLAAHEHNEHEAAQTLLTRLQQGQRIAYISDAGTPGVSDPGSVLAAHVHAAGLRVLPLPGASSITTLLSAAGALQLADWRFMGFLPSKAQERLGQVQALAAQPEAMLLLEAPHRIAALLKDLGSLGQRPLTIGRELSKQFEEIATMPCADAPAWLAAKKERSQGEFALLLHPAPKTDKADSNAAAQRVLRLLLAELPTKTAVKLAAEISGAPRNTLYDLALQWKKEGISPLPEGEGQG